MSMLVEDAVRESVIALAVAAAADILAIYDHAFDVELVGVDEEPHQRLLDIRVDARVGFNDHTWPRF